MEYAPVVPETKPVIRFSL